jgi:hypothetical protein
MNAFYIRCGQNLRIEDQKILLQLERLAKKAGIKDDTYQKIIDLFKHSFFKMPLNNKEIDKWHKLTYLNNDKTLNINYNMLELELCLMALCWEGKIKRVVVV